MKGIGISFAIAIIAEFVALLISLYAGWELETLCYVLAGIFVAFIAMVSTGIIVANKSK